MTMIDVFPLPQGPNPPGLGGWPITSPYGPRWGRLHGGIDLGVPQGTPLHAVVSGRIFQGWDPGGGGNWTRLVADDGNVYGYGHQSAFVPDADGHVDAGQLIGFVGNTGTSSGPHLHFAFGRGGGPYVDPYQILADAASRDAYPGAPAPTPTPPPEEDDVTPEEMQTLGRWMQEQSAATVAQVNAKIDALAWGIVVGNVRVLEAVNAAKGGGTIDVAAVQKAVADEIASRLQD